MQFSLFEAVAPSVLYHVTPRPEAIFRRGFLPASVHGEGETLGGPAPDAVSFTDNLKNAQDYRDGLEILQRAARGEYGKSDLHMLGEFYGLSYQEVVSKIEGIKKDDLRSEYSWLSFMKEHSPKKIPAGYEEELEKKLVLYFIHSLHLNYNKKRQRRMPWIFFQNMAGLKNAKNFSVLQISTAAGNNKPGPQKMTHHPGEHEWRVYDPENFDYTTLNHAPTG